MRHPIPDNALAQHTIVLGKTRSGKSSTMRLMVERLLDQKKPVCIVDPKGDWWGIKSSANGKKAGYEVVIFGGTHADVPVNAHSGKVVAELVAAGNRPALIDLGGWTVADRTRFFIDFASAFFNRARGHRWLVMDEVHNFAPQGKVLDPQAGMSLHWANRLASEGAGRGIVLISASQRPQKVHKDFVTSHETLIAKRVIHPLDRGAMKEWIDGCGDPIMGKEVLDSLAGLQRSQGWVWSPEINFGPKLIEFPMFKTYDSFAVQTGKAGRKLKGWASVNLDEVKSKLAIVVEEAKKSDPAELRKLIAAKDAEIRRLQGASPAKAIGTATDHDTIKKAEERGFEQARKKLAAEAEREVRERHVAILSEIAEAIGPLKTFMDKQLNKLNAKRPDLRAAITFEPSAPTTAPVHKLMTSVPPQRPSRAKPVTTITDADRPLGAERKPLAALASVHPAGMTEAQWAVAAGLKRRGGTWSTYVSRLRAAGRIVKEGDLFFVTDAGLDDLGGAVTQMPPPGPQLVEFWASRINGVGPMLRHLAGIYPESISREDLAEAINMAAGGGSFSTYISRLRSPGLIEVDADKNLRASPSLMGGQ